MQPEISVITIIYFVLKEKRKCFIDTEDFPRRGWSQLWWKRMHACMHAKLI